MTAINWAEYVLQGKLQEATKVWTRVKLKKFLLFELFSETRNYEEEIVSNRKSERYGEFVT